MRSIGKSCSSFLSSSLENLTTVSGAHSLSEAVLFLSLTLFGLVSSEHSWHLLQVEFGSEMGSRPVLRHNAFYSDLFIIYGVKQIVKSFFHFWRFF